jgi:hypothetical protein
VQNCGARCSQNPVQCRLKTSECLAKDEQSIGL